MPKYFFNQGQHVRALNAIDHIFLMLETRKEPMHVSGLCIFELPDGAGDDFLANLVSDIEVTRTKPSFPFNQVLNKGLFWERDGNFDVNHHFRHVALPKPGGIQELTNYISREHGLMLDRAKPLWEFHLIDGLAPACDGGNARFALFLKIHHAMVDGIAAMRLLQLSLSTSVQEQMTAPFWSLSTKYRSQINAILPIHKPPLQIIKEQLATIYPVGRELINSVKNHFGKKDPHFTSTFDAPKSILNQKISSSRQLSFISFEKGRFAKIAEHFGATTNDVLLAICAGALREYLLAQDALPAKPLIAFVPISLRRDKSAMGNQLSFILTNLATHKSDPAERLLTIKASVDDGKQRFSRMNQAQVINYSLLAYGMAFANLSTGVMPTHQAFNLIISNVPGDGTPMYLNGARLTGIFPASVLLDGQALNITLTNYQDKIDFGITACQSALPNIEQLTQFLEQELLVFEELLLIKRADLDQANMP